ncbi:DUF262 domain-containing protein [Methylotenera sp.]|uniref:DUF262 domain-containing protein n=1 Tax=Methylotenera sp. TaxID=2051956 RepID=UPI00273559D9|nr:DUF262 domain-containing protein [Methylotenera sp.]MDP3212030.1 DUF262 domain-containing protein [Methylotenera sp.]
MEKTTQSEQSSLGHKYVGEIRGTFFVPDYQRGYRWDTRDVQHLLDDIWENGENLYSLQPVVVKLHQKGDDDKSHEWELIDGQQRLTTLYLIFLYMRNKRLKNVGEPYAIHYKTRLASEVYLKNLNPDLDTFDPKEHETNIDYFHLYKAYERISQWFESKGDEFERQSVADQFYVYLFKSVRIIWYEVPPNMDKKELTALFIRLNVGRILLTDAELVKALLLSEIRNLAINRDQEIAAQWDGIERDLHAPDVWAFVSGVDAAEGANQYPTRISLLLDTLAPLADNHPRRRYYTFEKLRKQIEGDPTEFWKDVLGLHALILGWYENRQLYHKVGFLVATGTSFGDLVSLAKDQKKSDFKELLNKKIRDTIKISASELENLSYEKKSDCNKLLQILLLMNVETICRTEHTTQRFPFRLHVGKVWSLEHIHAQNAESLNTVEQWKTWLNEHKKALLALPTTHADCGQLVQDIELATQQADTAGNFGQTFRNLAARVVEVFNAPAVNGMPGANDDVHSISNLALLSRDDNSALSNSVFEVKRQIVLDIDRKGGYIPVCTRNVFLKYYTGAEAQQIHYWGPQDRKSYFDNILFTLNENKYLKPEEPA